MLTSTWDLGEWKADESDADDGVDIYMWIVRARVDGAWDWGLTQHEFSGKVAGDQTPAP